MKGVLFLDGDAPQSLPDLSAYQLVACTDGALGYLENLDGSILDQLSFVSGDFDSYNGDKQFLIQPKFIHTPDQEETDFFKALKIISEKGITNVDVFGGSGGEQDHFLGNLNVAMRWKDKLDIKFFDAHSSYYFIPKQFKIEGVKGKMVSLFPFPKAEGIVTKGLQWPLYNEDLDMLLRIGTRNVADNEVVEIEYKKGELLIFINH